MRPTGVLGNVPADRAGLLAAWIRRVKQAMSSYRFGQLDVRQPGFNDGETVLHVDFHDPAHPGCRDDDTTARWHRAAAKAGAGASRGNGYSQVVAGAHHPCNLLRPEREDDGVRLLLLDGAIEGVHHQILAPPEDVFRPHEP